MKWKKRLPIGIEDFAEMIGEEYYYVDKTKMIEQFLESGGKATLFTRPRRFGKSLNMSMLQRFFEIGSDKTWFDGLYISQKKKLCEKYQAKFPVVSISLKGVNADSYKDAYDMLAGIINEEAARLQFLSDSDKLTQADKRQFEKLLDDTMEIKVLTSSIRKMTAFLEKHYGEKVIVLIDEYDVPLAKANENGYYKEMVLLIRNLFENVLKTNNSLKFAVLTGCLRISKESIFTGLNNFKVLSIMDVQFDEYFGFTDKEVGEMLSYYGLQDAHAAVKEWYDGYQFGNVSVYCPWDVIRYCDALRADPSAWPEDYWSNTSGNSIVRRFIDKANVKTRDEIERLIAGEMIVKEVRQELTYSELDKTIENLWSVLFMTGYLTQRGRVGWKTYRLGIPNAEIRELFIYQIREWFRETSNQNPSKLDTFCEAFVAKDAKTIEELFHEYLWNTISIRDTAVANQRKENFYHGMLLGLLRHKENWMVMSNAESGEGYSDILIETPNRIGVVIEVKYAESDDKLEESCKEALRQIEEKQYTARLKADGMRTIFVYGIACFKKHCKVAVG